MAHSLVSLGQVAKFIRGVTYKPDELMENFSDGSVVCVRTANIQEQLDESDLRSIPAVLVKSTDRLLKEGDILVSTANSWNLVGKCCWVPKLSYAAAPGGFIAALRADPARIDPRYLYHWFNSPKTQADARNCGRRTTNISNMDLGRCLALQIPLPQLAEQRRIAAILDMADALRAKRRESIAKLDQLLQSVFLDMFGDPIANPKGWRKVRMDQLLSVTRGGSPRPIDKFLGGEHHWVKIGDATKGDDVYISHTKEKIISEGLSKTTHLKAGSLIFANCGVSLGFARILKIDGCIHDGWLALGSIDPHHLDKLFLLKALNSITAYFRALAPEGTQPNLNTGIMKAFELIVPPLDMQQRFAQFVESVRARKLSLLKAESDTERLFSSLQNAAFTGGFL